MEVAVAPDGNIWFAEVLEGRPGRLDPKTGAIQEYAVPIMAGAQSEKGIYGLAIDRRGAIWFTDIGDNAIGRFQPQRGQFNLLSNSDLPQYPLWTHH